MNSKADSDSGIFTKTSLLGQDKTGLRMFEPDIVLLDLIAATEFHFSKHRQALPEFIIVLEGKYHGILNGNPIEADAGNLLFVPSNVEHEDKCASPCKLLIIMFALRGLWHNQISSQFFEMCTSSAALSGRYTDEDEIKELISTIESSENDEDFFAKNRNHARGILLIWLLLSKFEKSLKASTKNLLLDCPFANQLESYFEAKRAEKYNADELCACLNMSRRRLEMKCREIFNQSPRKLFLQSKMRYAERRLLAGFSSKQVADEIGFASQFSFSSAFKQYTGRCPSDYRPMRISRQYRITAP